MCQDLLFGLGSHIRMGAAWAAGGQNIFYGIAGIAFCMWITGRIRQSWTGMWLFWFLPVFFVSGFVIFSHSMQEIRDDTSENQCAVLRGIVWQCEEKEKSYAVTLSMLRLTISKQECLFMRIRTGKPYRLEMASRSEVFCRNRREHRIRGNLIRDLIIMAKVSAI